MTFALERNIYYGEIKTSGPNNVYHTTPHPPGPTKRETNRLIKLLEQDDETNKRLFDQQKQRAKAEDKHMDIRQKTGDKETNGSYLQRQEQENQIQKELVQHEQFMDLPAEEAITASGRKMRAESGQQIPETPIEGDQAGKHQIPDRKSTNEDNVKTPPPFFTNPSRPW